MRALSIYGAGAPFDIIAAPFDAAISICSACAELDMSRVARDEKRDQSKADGESRVFETARDESRVAR